MPRRHVHISLPPDLHDRARAVVDRLPGASLSGMIEEFLAEMVPTMEQVLDAAEEGDEKAMRTIFGAMLGDKLVHMMLGEEVDTT